MIHHLAFNFFAYISGVAAGIGTLFAQLAMQPGNGWLPVVIQAGMTGVVVLLIMKFFPNLVKAQQESEERYLTALENQRKAYQEVITHMSDKHAAQVDAWRHVITNKGYCPVRDGNQPK